MNNHIKLIQAITFVMLPLMGAEVPPVRLESSIPSPAPVGALITWTASLPNPKNDNLWYRFIVRSYDEGHRIFKDFGPDNTFKWSPVEREGLYTVEVAVRNLSTGQQSETVVPYTVRSNVTDGRPVVRPTSHPLVFLYSAPPCPAGNSMMVYFLNPKTGIMQNTPPKRCNGLFSLNFYIAGLRGSTSYYVRHHLENNGVLTEGPLLTLTSGAIPGDVPEVTGISGHSEDSSQVLLAGSLFTKFVATDLGGNTIWYYPDSMLFLTRPQPGGFFFGIDQNQKGNQSKQIVREFDLAGITVAETNAARVNEQLAKMGKRQIGGFHHEARRTSDGHIIVLATVEQIMSDVQGAGPMDIVGDMILALNKDLEVVWTWDAFDHLDVRRMATQFDICVPNACPPLFLAKTGNDWLHGNSLSETPEGDLLYSSRSQDWVIKINYQHGYGTGKVEWRLGKDGDFTMVSSDPNPWFSHQHDPEFEDDGMLSLFDNGNLRRADDETANSRGQVLKLDEASRTVQLVLNADLGYYSFALGSAQKLANENYSFGAGFRPDGTGVSLEVDGTGNTVFSAENSVPQYRTFRMKDLYTP